jgi:hypothetical protein
MSITVNFVKEGKIAGTVQTNVEAHTLFSDLLKFSCNHFSLGEEAYANYCLASTKFGFVLNQLPTMEKVFAHLGMNSYL